MRSARSRRTRWEGKAADAFHDRAKSVRTQAGGWPTLYDTVPRRWTSSRIRHAPRTEMCVFLAKSAEFVCN